MRAYERFLKYIRVYTTSDDNSETIPSTQRQFDLGNELAQEMKALGISNVRIDDKCYVYGEIPAAKGYEDAPGIGFIAHMDTAPDFSGEGVNPQIIENYDGSRVALGNSGLFLDPADFPHLSSLKGRTLITTDGTTLLGGDDKAGIAEIMTLAEILLKEDIPHGKICIGFTPDEEIGRGADCFDIENCLYRRWRCGERTGIRELQCCRCPGTDQGLSSASWQQQKYPGECSAGSGRIS